jgi:hypothetical protein
VNGFATGSKTPLKECKYRLPESNYKIKIDTGNIFFTALQSYTSNIQEVVIMKKQLVKECCTSDT